MKWPHRFYFVLITNVIKLISIVGYRRSINWWSENLIPQAAGNWWCQIYSRIRKKKIYVRYGWESFLSLVDQWTFCSPSLPIWHLWHVYHLRSYSIHILKCICYTVSVCIWAAYGLTQVREEDVTNSSTPLNVFLQLCI